MKLKNLVILTAVLFSLSLAVFFNENRRGTDLAAGSDFIKGLDIEKVQKIVLTFEGDKKIVLLRENGRFVLENFKSYPAKTEKVNELIYRMASIEVGDMVKGSASAEEMNSFELGDKNGRSRVELFDKDGNQTISFRIGKAYKGRGHYLVKSGRSDVYISRNALTLSSSYKDYIDFDLIKMRPLDVEKVTLPGSEHVEIVRKENEFVVQDTSRKDYKKEKIQEYVDHLAKLSFEDYYSLSDREVDNLRFDKELEIKLKSNLIYKIGAGAKDQDYYLKFMAMVDEMPGQVVISKDDSTEKLKGIEEMVKAQSQAQRFNFEKANWVYKVKKETYDKIIAGEKSLL